MRVCRGGGGCVTVRNVILLLLVFVFAGCDERQELAPYSYMLTVVIDTPEGPRSGYSVIDVRETLSPRPGWCTNTMFCGDKDGSLGGDFAGEAVAVDLPNGETAFLPLETKDNDSLGNNRAWAAFAVRSAVAVAEPPFSQLLPVSVQNGTGNVPMNSVIASLPELPVKPRYFVRFRDLNDPQTAEKVTAKDFSRVFGSGVSLKSVTVSQVTVPMEVRLHRSKTEAGVLEAKSIRPDPWPGRRPIIERLPWAVDENSQGNDDGKSFFSRYLSISSFRKSHV